MKKLLIAVLVLLSTQSFSQGLFSRLSFGIKAGANYSNYTNADFATDALVGCHAGAMVNFRITKRFSIQEEFLFSSQGAKVKGDVFGNENVKVYYLTVPFLFKYRTPVGFYIELGPQVGMKAKEEVGNSGTGDFAKKLDLAGAGGIGWQSNMGLGAGFRYIAGISKVGDFKYTNIKTDFRTNVIQGSVFYIF